SVRTLVASLKTPASASQVFGCKAKNRNVRDNVTEVAHSSGITTHDFQSQTECWLDSTLSGFSKTSGKITNYRLLNFQYLFCDARGSLTIPWLTFLGDCSGYRLSQGFI